jgi:hypothetical protein
MNIHSGRSAAPLGIKAIIAIISCVFGLALIIFGVGTGTSPKKDVAAAANASVQGPQKKPIRAWNMALGNVVVVAQELGFGIKAANDAGAEQSTILARFDGQLQSLREFYRQEGEKNPALMGGMLLQFNVNASGEVSQVKEIASRITDVDFKKAVIAEVSKWSFQDITSDNLTVNCPLLFVREGMDITTLVQWEKSLGQFSDKNALAKSNMQPTQQSKVSERTKSTAVAANAVAATPGKTAATTAPKSPATAYQIKYPTSLRKEPNFNSASLGAFTIGTKVFLLSSRGEWLEVRSEDRGLSGFIRKEFVTPVELAQKP